MNSAICIVLIVVGLAVFLVGGALAISLNNAHFLWVQVVPREERLLMAAVACLGLLTALCGSGRLVLARMAAARARKCGGREAA